jgi:hypothetical protein
MADFSSGGSLQVRSSSSKCGSGSMAMEYILRFLGLLHPIEATFYDQIRAVPIILLSLSALVYETFTRLFCLFNNPSGNLELTGFLDSSQFVVKTSSTLLTLMMFWQKSSTIARIRRKVKDLEESKTDLTTLTLKKRKSENKITGLVWMTCLLYLATVIGTRMKRILGSVSPNGHWNDASPPWDKVFNVMQREVLILLTENLTEFVKLLCSGYLAVLLSRFGRGLAAQCKFHLELASKESSEEFSISINIERAWHGREEALNLTASIQNELGLFLALTIFADTLSLYSTLTTFLFGTFFLQSLYCGVIILMYLVCILSIASGLIYLGDEVSML